jgi:hypothetical protein
LVAEKDQFDGRKGKMPDDIGEVLVVLEADGAGEALAGLRRVAHVIQILPPRLVLVRREGALPTDLPGVASVYESLGSDLPADLSENERRFVAAWQARRGKAAPASRFADGLDWDARGFEPPDPPPGRR